MSPMASTPTDAKTHRRERLSSRGSDPGSLEKRRQASRSSSCTNLDVVSRSAPPTRGDAYGEISPLPLHTLVRDLERTDLSARELSSRRSNRVGNWGVESPVKKPGSRGEDITSPPPRENGLKRPVLGRHARKQMDCPVKPGSAGTPHMSITQSSPAIPTMPGSGDRRLRSPKEQLSDSISPQSQPPAFCHQPQSTSSHSPQRLDASLKSGDSTLSQEAEKAKLLAGSKEHDYWDADEDAESDSHGQNKSGLTCTFGSKGVRSLSFSKKSKEDPRASMIGTFSSPTAIHGAAGRTWVRGDVLGTGSLGVVFKALDQRTGEIFAVKEVHIDHKVEQDLAFRANLENELKICQELYHPNIVSYYGHDYIEGRLYIYLEYMPGGSLAQVLSQFGALEEELAAVHAKELLQGLVYLHTRDPHVLHRDIKGANILVGLDCSVKLSDFGCSKRSTESLSVTMKGSIPWMAPEVITQAGYGRAADVWSFGCVCIEMATGKAPWGAFDNPVAAMFRIGVSGETPPLPENVSALFQDFIKQCVLREKTQRPKAAELLNHEFILNARRCNY